MILAPRMGYFGIMISGPLVWAGMAVMLGIGFAANKTFRKENIPQYGRTNVNSLLIHIKQIAPM